LYKIKKKKRKKSWRKKWVKVYFFCEIFFSRFKRVLGKEKERERERVVRELESHSDLSCN